MRQMLIVMGILLGMLAGRITMADTISNMRQKICLNGVWDFKAAGTSENEVPDGDWKTIRVPGSWVHYGPKNFTVYPDDAASPHAWFRRTFFVPESWADGRKIRLLFMDLDWSHKIYINGKLADEFPSYRLCFSTDITSFVRFGEENEVVVMTKKKDEKDWEAGIVRSVYLETVPPVHIEYSHAVPSVREMTLTVKTRVRNDDKVQRVIKVHPVVRDNGKTVLDLPVKEVTVPPGESVQVETVSPWSNPVLWGFGQYGRPYLYHLVTNIEGQGVHDTRYDRFGFREFRVEGTKFALNGKRFSIRGDLFTRTYPLSENPETISAYYQGMWSDGINFQRMHSAILGAGDSSYWFQVGDELGHPVEAQLSIFDSQPPDAPEHLEQWTRYLNYNFNHPSIVMWCPDNERIQGADVIANAKTVMVPWNTLTRHIRKLDPDRIIDYQHGFALYAGVRVGSFDKENFMTFNIHPYGKLDAEIKKAKRSVGFTDSVPVVVGEMWPFPANFDLLDDPRGAYVEQHRRAMVYQRDIELLARGDAAGMILCAESGFGFYGFANRNELHMGPWSDHLLVRDEAKPDKPIVARRLCMVEVPWPSLSGEGVKVEKIYPTDPGGWGHNFNWFDPTRPIFYRNIVDEMVGRAFEKISGERAAPHAQQRAPEVVVCLGIDAKPVEGAYVYLVPLEDQAAPPAAIMTDGEGTAWFHLWDIGKYKAVGCWQGKTYEKSFEIVRRPELTGKAGYNHITWVDLKGISGEKRRQALDRPAKFTPASIRRAGEMIVNGDMEFWENEKQIVDWNGPAIREVGIRHGGLSSVRLTGAKTAITRMLQVKAGCRYKISGWIYKVAGNRNGVICVKNGQWKDLVLVKGSETVGTWQRVETEFAAENSETVYFYCRNDYMGEKGVCLYDDVSMTEISERKPERNTIADAGPFMPNEEGFIRDWLVCGPFPNLRIDEAKGGGYSGHRTDLLKVYGGEVNAEPKFGTKYKVTFPPQGPWIEGEGVVMWDELHSQGGGIFLNGVQLPELGLTADPPSMVCAYLACTIESPDARELKLAIGSDDGYKIWLNKELIGEFEDGRGAQPDQEVYSVKLKQGENRLLLKIFQLEGGWQVYLRFLDQNNQPVRDLKVKLAG